MGWPGGKAVVSFHWNFSWARTTAGAATVVPAAAAAATVPFVRNSRRFIDEHSCCSVIASRPRVGVPSLIVRSIIIRIITVLLELGCQSTSQPDFWQEKSTPRQKESATGHS
jgi:hypothetical protein